MRAAGLRDPFLYPGSYSDWTQSDMPVAVGPEPGRSARVTDATASPQPFGRWRFSI